MNAELDRAISPASTGTSRRTSATTSWRRSRGSRATTRSRSSAPTSTSWRSWPSKVKKTLARRRRRRERGRLPHPGPVEPGVPRRSGEVPELGRQRGRRQQRRPDAPSAARPCTQMTEGEKTVRHHPALAQWLRDDEDGHPQHPGGHHQQPGVAPGRPRPAAARRRARAGIACRRTAAVAGRPRPARPTASSSSCRGRLWATWSRRSTTDCARIPAASSCARRLDHLPRAGQAADRHQVQRARPRPGRRRRRGPGEDQPTCSSRPTGPTGAASSRRWRKPRPAAC